MVTLILLPGMDGTGDLFSPFVSALGSEFGVAIIRYPTSEALDYPALETVARSSLPGDRPFVLLGESFSGPVAVSLAASAPAGLVGLILCCSFVRKPRPLVARFRPLVQFFPVERFPFALLTRVLLGGFSTERLRSALARALAQVSPAALRARLRSVLEVDVSSKLKQLRVPALYLRASEDHIIPKSASIVFARLAPQSTVIELEAPHLLLQAVPTEAARVVTEFVRQVTMASQPMLQPAPQTGAAELNR